MPDPQGRLRYAGVWCDGAFSVPRTPSCNPDTIVADFNLSKNLPQVGDIEVWYGSSFITLPRCRLIRQEVQTSDSGRMWRCIFQDRRWVWNYASSMGNFCYASGLSDNNGFKLIFNQVEMIELLIRLFAQLGDVPNFNIGTRINGAFTNPTVHMNLAPASVALATLLDSISAVACLNWNNSISVFTTNTGDPPPNDSRVCEYAISSVPPTIPEFLAMFSEPTEFLTDIPLSAVGFDVTSAGAPDYNNPKPIDQLSYSPTSAGKPWDPPHFNNVDPTYRQLAVETIFRFYQVRYRRSKLQVAVPNVQAGLKPGKKVWEWFNPDDFVIGDSDDEYSRLLYPDVKGKEPIPEIWGFYCTGGYSKNNNLTPPPAAIATDQMNPAYTSPYTAAGVNAQYPLLAYTGKYRFDRAANMVIFQKPVYYNNSNPVTLGGFGPIIPAFLVMRAWHHLRRKYDRETMRQFSFIPTGSPFAIPGLVQPSPMNSPFFVSPRVLECTKWPNWTALVEQRARDVFQQFAINKSATVQYKGFAFDINVNGCIKGVRFDCGPAGHCTTTVAWNEAQGIFFDDHRLKEIEASMKFTATQMLRVLKKSGLYDLSNSVQP
jgi:hypothetical protein